MTVLDKIITISLWKVFCLITLADYGIGCRSAKRVQQDLPSPFTKFIYSTNDILCMKIVLQNVPAGATKYALNYQTDNCSKESMESNYDVVKRCNGMTKTDELEHQKSLTEDINVLKNESTLFINLEKAFSILSNPTLITKVLSKQDNVVNRDQKRRKLKKVPKYKEIKFEKKLTVPSYKLDLELYYNEETLCSTKNISFGLRDDAVSQNNDEQSCLTRGDCSDPCKIYVDLENKCEESINITNMNHCYIKAHTYNCVNSDRQTLPGDTIHQWYQEANDTYIGLIPPIEAVKTKFTIKLAKFDINTYIFSTIQSEQKIITQKKKVLLQYINDTEEFNVTNEIQYNEQTEVEFDCREYLSLSNYTQVCLINPKGDDILTYNLTEVKMKFNMADSGCQLCCLFYTIDNNTKTRTIERFIEKITLLTYDDTAYNTTYYILVIASLVGIVLLILLIYVAIKKFSRKKPNPEAIGLDNFDNVLYADLDLQPAPRDRLHYTEQSPYAQVIGELKPRI